MRKLLLTLFLAAAALLYAAPILFMVYSSFKPDGEVLVGLTSGRFFAADLSWQNYVDVFHRVSFGRYLFNSLFITLSVVLLGLVVNSLAGYAFARLHWFGHKALFGLVLALMIIPFEAIAVPMFYQMSYLGWRDSYLIQILPFVANAFSIYLFYTFFIGLPKEFEEAARVDGAGTFRIFTSLILPNSKPAFASVTILTFLMQWGTFLWPLMVTSGERVRPLPVAVAQFQTLPPLQWGDIMAFGVMMVAPVMVIFLLFQRWFVAGIAATGTKG
ncbi:MAG: carbohydrate ABC transporter permease [Candidatus Electrothrix sp. AW1]|nr:carbohydrate ABC transporter permease [Candidatus Electrothrix gigas]